jgi:hypothetical protein
MVIIALIILAQVHIKGYVETRPYVYWSDSTNLSGYSRGWLELTSRAETYGTQLGLDIIVPYDTTDIAYALESITVSRLALWIGPEHLRCIIGKQRLYWGVGRVFRPLDVFNRTDYFDPEYERTGSTAAVAYWAIDAVSSMRAVFIPHCDLEQVQSGVRLGSSVFKHDIGVTVMHRSDPHHTLVGAELTGELHVGYWGEYRYSWQDENDHSQFILGLDYTFPPGLYLMAEVFFDGSGVADPDQYDLDMIATGERVTLAQRYLYMNAGIFPNPFAVIQPQLSGLVNLDDEGFIVIPQVMVSLFENTEITIGSNLIYGGSSTEFKNIVPFDGSVYLCVKIFF